MTVRLEIEHEKPSRLVITRENVGRTGGRGWRGGTEAVLKLRALVDNGDFDSYWAFHLDREHQRLYPSPDQHRYQLTA